MAGSAFEEMYRFLDDVNKLLLALQNDPDEATIERALRTLTILRDGLEAGMEVRRRATDLRDRLVGHLALAAPSLTMKHISSAAGFGDSYGSRVARKHGAQPRAIRPRKAESDTGESGEGGARLDDRRSVPLQ